MAQDVGEMDSAMQESNREDAKKARPVGRAFRKYKAMNVLTVF